MLWYDGCIEDAVRKVKSTGSFLLVFVRGFDNLSNEYETFLNGVTGLKDGSYVALKLTSGSTALQQFKQIYIKVPVPSVFLIQNNGIPLSVVSADKISEARSAIRKTVTKLNDKFEKEKEVENVNVTTGSAKKNLEEPLSKPLDHAKSVGYKIADVSECELKQRLSEIRAFPRFLRIASSSDLDPAFPPASVPQQSKIHSARLQFRLPNNETPSWEFPDLSTLMDVRAYIMEKVNLSPNFKFMRTYPRTAFTPGDERKTLSELSLTPSATLIVVPIKLEDKNVQADPGDVISRPFFFSTVLKAFLLPLFAFIKFLKKHIFRERDEIESEESKSGSPSATVRRNGSGRKFGSNIHGFKFERDDSDGEHPDNGNSTQQSYQKK